MRSWVPKRRNPPKSLGWGGVSHSGLYRSGTAGTSDASNEWREAESAAITAKAGSESDFYVSPERRAIIFPISRKEQNNDLRDLLIAQQVRRIDELERQVDMLEALLHSGRRGQGIIFLASETRIGRAGLVCGQ